MLLRTATEIVQNDGWGRLNMSELAKRANVSRQLIYHHFDSMEDLMVATGTHIFQQVYAQTSNVLEAFDAANLVKSLAQVQHLTLDLPAGQSRALWQVIASAFPPDHDLTAFGRRMRHLLTNMYQGPAMKAFGIDEKKAAGVSWMLIMAFWGGHQLIQDGELSKDEAVESLNWLVANMAKGALSKD
jgi:AcrR family transcriptional regulator